MCGASSRMISWAWAISFCRSAWSNVARWPAISLSTSGLEYALQFQPSEILKVALVLYAAQLLAARPKRLRTLVSVVFPVSLPGILTVVIFTFSLVVNEFVYAITFITTSSQRTISAGVPTELIRGDVFFWGGLMAATLIPAIPLALLYNVFLDRFIAGFRGGAFR